jgi:hypothetical protein
MCQLSEPGELRGPVLREPTRPGAEVLPWGARDGVVERENHITAHEDLRVSFGAGNWVILILLKHSTELSR